MCTSESLKCTVLTLSNPSFFIQSIPPTLGEPDIIFGTNQFFKDLNSIQNIFIKKNKDIHMKFHDKWHGALKWSLEVTEFFFYQIRFSKDGFSHLK